MHHKPTKRDFLKGRFRRTDRILPPGSVEAFYDACTKCGACAQACPSEIITRDEDGFPVVDPTAGECLFCSACAEICEEDAIRPATGWDFRAELTTSCLSLNSVTCRTCEDFCDNQAIGFRLMQGGRSTPIIDAEACTGCGSCVSSCPAGALKLSPVADATTNPNSPHNEDLPC